MMRSGNPALKESTFLDLGSGTLVQGDAGAMTLNGTVNKTGFLLLLTVLTAAFSWSQAFGADGQLAPGFAGYVWGGAIGGLVIALVTVFKKQWAPVTAPLYALVEGFFLGAMVVSYSFTGLMLVPILILVIAGVIDVGPAVALMAAWCVLFPLAFYRTSKSLWMMAYYLALPSDLPANGGGVEPR